MLVAAVIKYADNVLKGLATGVSVVVATAASMVLFGTPLSGQFSMGAAMILVSVYLFSNNVPNYCNFAKSKNEDEDTVEMMNPLVLPK
jgi:UDP-sugar transporter A1/2/3